MSSKFTTIKYPDHDDEVSLHFAAKTDHFAATSRPKPSANTPQNIGKPASATHHQNIKSISHHSLYDITALLCTSGGSLLVVNKRWSYVVEIRSLVFCPTAAPMVSCRFFNGFCDVQVTPYRAAVSLALPWDGDDADSMALRSAWMTAARLIFLFWDSPDWFKEPVWMGWQAFWA